MPAPATGIESALPTGDTVRLKLTFHNAENAQPVYLVLGKEAASEIWWKAAERYANGGRGAYPLYIEEAKRHLLGDVSVEACPCGAVSKDSLRSLSEQIQETGADDLRGHVKAKGYSVAGWAKANGWKESTARSALSGCRGKRKGATLSQAIRRKALDL